MKTASFIQFNEYAMRRDYLDEFRAQPDFSRVYAPIDFGAIDAPQHMPAGCTKSYVSLLGNKCFPLPASARRDV